MVEADSKQQKQKQLMENWKEKDSKETLAEILVVVISDEQCYSLHRKEWQR